MKRFTAILLIVILMLSLVACGKDITDDPNASPDVASTDKPTTTKAPKTSADPTESADPAESAKPTESTAPNTSATPTETVNPEDILNNEDYQIGVTEEGQNISVTVETDTEFGRAICKMTYVYNGEYLEKVTATYILPTPELAQELSEALPSDESIVASSIKVTGTNVACDLVDSEIADFRTISRDELLSLLNLALSLS